MSAARCPQSKHLVRGRTRSRSVGRSIDQDTFAACRQLHCSQKARMDMMLAISVQHLHDARLPASFQLRSLSSSEARILDHSA